VRKLLIRAQRPSFGIYCAPFCAPLNICNLIIKKTFGNFKDFQAKFNDAGAKQFGSGWVWLAGKNGEVQIMTTPNQDSPISQGLFPIMGNDVWEHAYYLKYNNRRPEYLQAWWNVVNWEEINQRYEAFRSAHEPALAG
jgi:Fe-Mn family superoxide dismutase